MHSCIHPCIHPCMHAFMHAHRALGEHVEEEGEDGVIDPDPLASEPHFHVLWHRDGLGGWSSVAWCG